MDLTRAPAHAASRFGSDRRRAADEPGSRLPDRRRLGRRTSTPVVPVWVAALGPLVVLKSREKQPEQNLTVITNWQARVAK